MDVRLDSSWKERLAEAFAAPSFTALREFVREEYQRGTVFPPPRAIFRALDLCPFPSVRVVILGQDPYHGVGQANGLSFAVPPGVALPPSLRNIYKELAQDLSTETPTTGDLSAWAQQGVLLLNATLTVRAASPGSHQNRGWEEFTDAIIDALAKEREGLVFILWGNYARAKGARIDRTRHAVIESPHPSPFSASTGFFGSRPFSRTNEYLVGRGEPPIEWLRGLSIG